MDTFSVVSGSINADYIETTDTNEGRPVYVRVGGDPATDWVKYQGADVWALNDASLPADWAYFTIDGGVYPWTPATWVVQAGVEPVPVVTQT